MRANHFNADCTTHSRNTFRQLGVNLVSVPGRFFRFVGMVTEKLMPHRRIYELDEHLLRDVGLDGRDHLSAQSRAKVSEIRHRML